MNRKLVSPAEQGLAVPVNSSTPHTNTPSVDSVDSLVRIADRDRQRSEALPTSPANGEASFSLDRATALRLDEFPNPAGLARFPPTTIANLNYMLVAYGISVRYDVIKKRLRFAIPGVDVSGDNADNVALTEIVSLAVLNRLQPGLIPDYINAIADRNRFNPVKDWIESIPWDGKDRIAAIQETLTVSEDYPIALRNVLIHKWLLSAVAAAITPDGFRCRGVLTLQGKQSIGKTSWVLSLLPEYLRAELLKIDHHLDPSNKDSILGAICHWICELGELDSSFRKDVARLKGVLTSPTDKVRRPYAKADSEYPRRTVFCATVNAKNFLVDTSGNSRWWTLPVVAINSVHNIDMQQLYAQLAAQVHAGGEWWLTREEELLLDQQNSAHLSISVIRERLKSHLELGNQPAAKVQMQRKKAIEVLQLLGFEHPTNGQAKECAEVLRELIGDSKRINGFDKWLVPVPDDAHLDKLLSFNA